MAIILHAKKKGKIKKMKGEALLDLMLTTRKEVIEFTILKKKKPRIKIIDFKKVNFNKL